MNRVHCTNCGRDGHPKWQCPYPPKESTAARKDVPRLQTEPVRLADQDALKQDVGSNPTQVAGTQVLPVDTNLEGAHRLGEMPQTVNRGEASSEKPTSSEARFDKKAWMREYMRDHRKGILRRARKKASAEGKDG